MIEKNWRVAQVGALYYALPVPPESGIYDPANIRHMTARFSAQDFTRAEAVRLVDKMNAKGPAIEVTGRGQPCATPRPAGDS